MRFVRYIAGGLAVLVLGVFVALLVTQRSAVVAREVFIARPPMAVWAVLVRASEYPAWNPFIQRVDGTLAVGARVVIALGDEADRMEFRPVVLDMVPGSVLRWRGSLGPGGLFDGEHSFVLTAEGGGTKLVQSERFSGLLVGRLTEGLLQDTGDSFGAMNSALKARVEATQ